jgi:hypothetical protein
VTQSQFNTLLAAVDGLREEISNRLDHIERRLRAVEVDQAKASAIRAVGRDAELGVQWKVGILVSAVGIIATLIVSLTSGS